LLVNPVRSGHFHLVKYAGEEVKVDVNIKDHTSKKDTPSALHCSLEAGFQHISTYLIEKNADVNLAFAGWTPFMMAARMDADEIAQVLLDSGRVDIHAVNDEGRPALLVAIDFSATV